MIYSVEIGCVGVWSFEDADIAMLVDLQGFIIGIVEMQNRLIQY
ncbi:MAG: hypothetical protein ACREV6_20485 [Clostridium sp.]